MLCYCDKCGNITDRIESELINPCYCCKKMPLKPIPKKYIDNFRWRDGDGKEAFIEEIVKTSPNLDQYLFVHKDEMIQSKNDDMNAKMAIGRAFLEEQTRTSKCPSCGSTNVSKIGIVNRMVSIGFAGLASSKIGKTHKCNHCGTIW